MCVCEALFDLSPGNLSVMVGIYIQSIQTPDGGRLQACGWAGSYRVNSPLFRRIKTLYFF